MQLCQIPVCLLSIGLLLGVISQQVNSQSDSDQKDDLEDMNRNRNSSLLGDCTVLGSSILTCPMLQDQTLTINNSVFLQGIEMRIRFCNSSLWWIFYYSNGTVCNMSNDYLKTPSKVMLGQLMLYADITTCINTANQSVIRVSLDVVGPPRREIFKWSQIRLSTQTSENCENGIIRPTEECIVPTTASMVTTTAGTVVTPRPTASMAPQRDHTVTVALATALPIVAVIIAITVIIVVVFIVGSRYWKRRSHTRIELN